VTGVQLAFPLDPLRDDLSDAEIEAAEAIVAYQREHVGDDALPAPSCACARAWTQDGETCGRCGRRLRRH
jgi:hypothetical protein